MFSCYFCLFFCFLCFIPLLLILFLYIKSRVKYIVHDKSGNSVILITGCDSGIGKASTEKLLKEGYHVISTIFTEQGKDILESFAQSIHASDRLTITNVDITNDDSVSELQEFISTFLKDNPSKKLIGLVNNAGVALGSPLEVQPMSQFRKQIDVNLIGHVHVSQVIIPFLRESKGRIVNIVSIAGRITGRSIGAYCASKHAMEAITNCQRLELALWNISVSAIEPGFIRTPMVVDSIKNMEKKWDLLLPNARDLYGETLQQGLKSGQKVLSYAIEPSNVANKIYHALSSPTPKTRYLVGYDAHIFAFLVGCLPDRFLDVIAILLK